MSLLSAIGLAVAAIEVASAQIMPDNTLGVERSVVASNVSVRGLPADLIVKGASRGANLFHSFNDFNVKALQRVYFDNPAGIENILARVTGSNRSDILGTLGVNGSANLFLLNPNGILFGPNSRLDIAGSFVASTANSFVFPDGSEFSATNPQAPPLLTVNLTPGVQYGAISPGSTIASAGNLAVGQDLTLVADNLDLQGQLSAGGNATLRATDRLRIRDSTTVPFKAAVQGNLLVQGDGSVEIAAFNHASSGFFSEGDMTLRSNTPIQGDARYTTGGNFQIQQLQGKAGDLNSPHDPIILAAGNVALGNYTGASLHILAGGSVTLGTITINTTDGLANTINPGNMTLFNGVDTIGSLASFTLSDGTPITVNGSSQTTIDIRAGVDWTTFAGGAPTAGPTFGMVVPPPTFPGTVTAADISVGSIQGGPFLFSPSLSSVLLTNQYRPNPSLSGDVTVGANALGASIQATGSGFAFGRQGTSTRIDSRGEITIDGKVDASSFRGNGGDVTLLADADIALNPDIFGNSMLSQSQFGLGGTILLKSQGAIAVNGGNISNSSAFAPSGTAGDLTLQAQSIQLRQGATLSTTILNLPGGQANAGSIFLQANETVALETGSEIASTTVFGAGNGGDISITAPIISLTGQSSLSSSSLDEGNAGNITLHADQQLRFDGLSGAFSFTQAEGQGGDIRIVANSFSMENGSLLDSNTQGRGNAGDAIVEVAGTLRIASNSDIFTSANIGSEGNGGDIFIQAGSFLLEENAQLNSDTFGQGQAGDIFVQADSFLLLNDRANITASTSGQADTGQVTLLAGELISILNDSQILTTVEAGAVGNAQALRLQAPNIMLNQNAQISAATFGIGNAGRMIFQGTELVSLNNHSTISTAIAAGALAAQPSNIEFETRHLSLNNNSTVTASTAGLGSSGNIFVRNADVVSLFNSDILTAVDSGAIGQGGTVDIQARTLLADNARIRSDTSGEGNAGNIFLRTSHTDLRFGSTISSAVNAGAIGQGGTVDFAADFLNLNQARILSSTEGQGDAGLINLGATQMIVLASGSTIASAAGSGTSGDGGSVVLRTPVLLILDGSQITVSSEGVSDSNAGRIFFEGNRVTIQDGSQLAATTSGGTSSGIRLNANVLELFRGGQIRTTTSGNNAAGDIVLQVLESITIDGDGSGLFANTTLGSSGPGGSISIDPEVMAIRNSAGIFVDSLGSGTGGNIQLQAGSLLLDNQARISAITASSQGGNIDLWIEDILLLRRNSLISATAGTAGAGGDGGNINILARFIVAVPDENSDITANAFDGRGGNIQLTAQGIFGLQFRPGLTVLSDITASSRFGLDGVVNINTLGIDPSRGLAPPPPLPDNPELSQGCQFGSTQASARFVEVGKSGSLTNPYNDLGDASPIDDLGVSVDWFGNTVIGSPLSLIKTPKGGVEVFHLRRDVELIPDIPFSGVQRGCS